LFLGLVFGQSHIDTTAITVADAVTAGAEHFLVAIDHIEDEIDVNGKILAERRVHVALQFDVVEAQNVLVNGVSVPLGYSELKIEAGLFEVDEAGVASPFDQIVKVDIRIFVGQRVVQTDDNSYTMGIFIQERVIGIQEKEVWQASVKEQVFTIQQDGTTTRLAIVEIEALQGEVSKEDGEGQMEGKHHGGHHGHHGHHGQQTPNNPNPEQVVDQPEDTEHETVGEKPYGSHGKCNLKKYWHKFMNWFNDLPFYLRVLLSFGIGLTLGFFGIAFIRCLCCVLCCRKKCPRSKEENYKKNIHLYSLQYTSLPQDEKEAEKKEAAQNV